MTNPLRIGIAGLGTVGAGTLKILQENAEVIAARSGRAVAVTAVSMRDPSKQREVKLDGIRVEKDARALQIEKAELDQFRQDLNDEYRIVENATFARLCTALVGSPVVKVTLPVAVLTLQPVICSTPFRAMRTVLPTGLAMARVQLCAPEV